MKVLVTGGCGFIGSNFVHLLMKDQSVSKLTNLDALTYAGHPQNTSDFKDDDRYKFVEGDLRNKSLVFDLVKEAELIVHFAAESHVDRSIESPDEFITTNIVGSFNLLEALKNTNPKARFVQVSTDEVYGSIQEGQFTTKSPIEPNSPYSASKAGADLLARSYHQTYGLEILITRSSNNYGPRQTPEKLIPLMIQRATAGQALPVYGDGSNVRDWIYVEDNCLGVWQACKKGQAGKVYHFGGECEKSNLEVVHQIIESTGANKDQIEFVKDRLGHDWRYALSIEGSEKELGWRPETDFNQGLSKTISWYKENGDWMKAVSQKIETWMKRYEGD